MKTKMKRGFITEALIAVVVLGALGVSYGAHKLDNYISTKVNESQKEDVAVGAYGITGGGTYRLKASVGTTDTSINLSSFKEPVSNTPYTMAYLNTSVGYGTIDALTDRPEFISFSGVTQNSDGSAVLTGVTRGLTRTPQGNACTASSTFAVRHPGQATFILSDSPCHFAEYAVKSNDEVITGSWTVPTPTAGGNPTTKTYVDNIVNGGTVSTDRSVVAATAGETVSTGQILYYNIYEAEWRKTDADVASTTDGVILGIAQGAGVNGGAISGGVLLHGMDTFQGTTLTPGQTLYVSGTAGATSTSAGTVNKRLGIVKDVNDFYFDPFYGNPQLSTANTWTATSTFSGNVVSKAFGGTGTDGALTLTSGTTTVNLLGATYVVKNYSSISITGTGHLEFSNANASGTVIMLKSQGACTLTSSGVAIMATSTGAIGGTGVVNATGTLPRIGALFPFNTSNVYPAIGGSPYATAGTGAGGAIGGLASTTSGIITATTTMLATNSLPIVIGGGGGPGGGGSNSAVGGDGGRGAGGLIIQCGGALNFTSTIVAGGDPGKVSTRGGDPNDDAGGGGGGGGGTVWVLYNYLTANSGTVSVAGGTGGDDGGDGDADECEGTNMCGGGGAGGASNKPGTAGSAATATDAGNGGAGGDGIYGIFENTIW